MERPLSAECAGETQLQIQGTGEVTIRVGSYMAEITSHAVNKLINGVDMVFGSDWMRANKVIINYAKMTCTIRAYGNSKHTIYPLSRGEVTDHNPTNTLTYLQLKAGEGSNDVSCDVISAKKGVKSLLKGMDYMILMVRQCPAAGGKPLSDESANRNGTERTIRGFMRNHDLPPDKDINGLIFQTGNEGHDDLVYEGQLGGNQPSTQTIAMVALGLKHTNLSKELGRERLQTQSATKDPSGKPNGVAVGQEVNTEVNIKASRPLPGVGNDHPDPVQPHSTTAYDKLLVREEDIKILLENTKVCSQQNSLRAYHLIEGLDTRSVWREMQHPHLGETKE
jgi:hypothetical protein